MKLPLIKGITVLLLGVALPTLPLYAQENKPDPKPAAPADTAKTAPEKKIDPDTIKALDEMADAQYALKSYSANLNFVMKQGDKTQLGINGQIQYALPNKFRIAATLTPEAGEKATMQAVSDSTAVYLFNSASPKTYQKNDAIPGSKNIVGGFMAMGATGLMAALLTEKQTGTKLLGPQATAAAFGPDESVDGVECRTIVATLSANPTMTYTLTFAIGKADSLLRRVTVAGKTPQADMSLTEAYSDVKVNPDLPSDTFTFVPPPDAKLAEPPKTPAGLAGSEKYYDPRLKVGAKPFAFSGKDLSGKTINLTAYRGRVVMVDFWATWCGPCVAELPNVIKVYNKYHGKGFDIIGVSLDEKGDRAKLTSFIKENKMPWPQIYDGGEWQSALATKFGVRAIPFTLLIGKDGKIAAVGARGESLELAVKKALAAK